MGEVWVITSGKGGVGKTTATANLGMGLALLGKRVAMVDADIGLRNLDVVLGLENRIVYDLVDVAEGYCRPRQALIKDKRIDGVYLLPAAQTRDKTAVSPDQMRGLCLELAQEFDYVLVDCPAGIEQGFRNAVCAADRALVVTTPEVTAVRDADRVIGLLEAMETRPPLLLINRVRGEMVRRGDMMSIEDMVEVLAIEVLGVIPEDEYIIVSSNRGEPAVLVASSRAGAAYRLVCRRLLGEDVKLPKLAEPNGWWGRLRRLIGVGTH